MGSNPTSGTKFPLCIRTSVRYGRRVTKPLHVVEHALELFDQGFPIAEVARRVGASRAAIRDWSRNRESRLESARAFAAHEAGDPCPLIASVPRNAYAYLFDQYLGDGCISPLGPRGVYRLRIATCDDYPDIRQRTVDAMSAIAPTSRVGLTQCQGCTEVSGYSKHWPCLFPQHGVGRKHERDIVLERWQQEIVHQYTEEFVAGLIHSDGCRATNIVTNGTTNKRYEYTRYFFTNVSEDILNLCADAFDRLGVEWTRNHWNSLSVAKKESVAILDSLIGRKT